MDSRQLLTVLKADCETKRYLGGVYPADRLPAEVRHPSVFIVNTDESNRPGTHWIAIYINTENGLGEFFYSYGQHPEFYGAYFKQFLDTHCVRFIHNYKSLQSLNTTVCGQYCLFFCLHRCRNIPLSKILSVFTDDSLVNDVLVQDFMEEIYDVNVPVVDFELICRQICTSRKSVIG